MISELKAVQAGNKEMSLALLLLSPSLGKNNESSDEDGEEEEEEEEEEDEEEDGGGRKRKARKVAKASSWKKARSSGSAGRGTAVPAKDEGEGGSSGMLDEKEMKRQLMM